MTLNKQIITCQKEQNKLDGPTHNTIEYVSSRCRESIDRIRKFRQQLGQKNSVGFSPMSTIMSNLDTLAFDAFKYGVKKRIIEDNPQYLLDSIYTYSRLNYIVDRLDSERDRSFGWVSPLIILAGKDQDLIDAYIHQFLPPNDLISRALYLALRDNSADRNDAQEIMKKVQARKTLPLYYKYMVQCFVSIVQRDSRGLSEGLDYITKKSWNMRDSLPIVSIVCNGIPIFAHAIYNLTKKVFTQHNTQYPPHPVHPFWDTDYDNFINQQDVSPALLYNIFEISPYLDDVVKILPQTIDIFSI